VVSDLKENIGGSTDLVKKWHGSADSAPSLSKKAEREASVNHSHVQCPDVFRSGRSFVLHAIFTVLRITAVFNHTVDLQSRQS